MLNTPRYGWTTVTVLQTTLGSASYLDDVPNMVLDAFIQYFQALADNHYTSFSLTFDGEGNHFGLFTFNNTLYQIDDTGTEADSYLNIQEVTQEVDDIIEYFDEKTILRKLALEVYHDIQNNLMIWAKWNPDDESTESELQEKLETLDRLLQVTSCN